MAFFLTADMNEGIMYIFVTKKRMWIVTYWEDSVDTSLSLDCKTFWIKTDLNFLDSSEGVCYIVRAIVDKLSGEFDWKLDFYFSRLTPVKQWDFEKALNFLDNKDLSQIRSINIRADNIELIDLSDISLPNLKYIDSYKENVSKPILEWTLIKIFSPNTEEYIHNIT